MKIHFTTSVETLATISNAVAEIAEITGDGVKKTDVELKLNRKMFGQTSVRNIAGGRVEFHAAPIDAKDGLVEATLTLEDEAFVAFLPTLVKMTKVVMPFVGALKALGDLAKNALGQIKELAKSYQESFAERFGRPTRWAAETISIPQLGIVDVPVVIKNDGYENPNSVKVVCMITDEDVSFDVLTSCARRTEHDFCYTTERDAIQAAHMLVKHEKG